VELLRWALRDGLHQHHAERPDPLAVLVCQRRKFAERFTPQPQHDGFPNLFEWLHGFAREKPSSPATTRRRRSPSSVHARCAELSILMYIVHEAHREKRKSLRSRFVLLHPVTPATSQTLPRRPPRVNGMRSDASGAQRRRDRPLYLSHTSQPASNGGCWACPPVRTGPAGGTPSLDKYQRF